MQNWDVFSGRETELNWQNRDKVLTLLIRDIEETCSTTLIIPAVRNNLFDLLALLQTARTQLALTSCKFFALLTCYSSPEEGEVFSEPLLSNILRVCGMSKRLIAAAGEECLRQLFLKMATLKVVATVLAITDDKNVGLRQRVFDSLLFAMRESRDRWLELSNRQGLADMEEIIVRSLSDASPTVRNVTANLFLFLKASFPLAAVRVQDRLDSSTAKQLRQILAKRPVTAMPSSVQPPIEPLVIIERNLFSSLSLSPPPSKKDDSLLEQSYMVNDKVPIPLQSISFIDENDILGGSSLKGSPCRIPVRSPSTCTESLARLVLSTPYRKYREFMDEPRESALPSPAKFSIAGLVEILQDSDSIVPAAVWKKLLVLLNSRAHEPLGDQVLASILSAICQRLSQLEVLYELCLVMDPVERRCNLHGGNVGQGGSEPAAGTLS